jgi:hypothetical protein
MPNSKIRAQQRVNSRKLDEEGMLLVRQRNFPKPTNSVSLRYRSEREIDRRKRQIARGQLTESNGLAVSSTPLGGGK